MNEEFERLLTQPTISVVEAGRILGRAPNAARRALKAGDIPSIKIGSQHRVPTAPLRQMLGLTSCDPKAA